MNTEQIAFIGALFLVAVLVWALVRQHMTLANLIPLPLAQDIVKMAVEQALAAAEAKAAETDTLTDDELVKLIRKEILQLFPPQSVQPPPSMADKSP